MEESRRDFSVRGGGVGGSAAEPGSLQLLIAAICPPAPPCLGRPGGSSYSRSAPGSGSAAGAVRTNLWTT